MASEGIGFIGLGNMGRPMASNLVKSGLDVVVHDAAGTQARAPEGVKLAASTASLAGRVEAIHLCVPNGRASESIAREIAGATDRRTRLVVDHSTIGTEAAIRVPEETPLEVASAAHSEISTPSSAISAPHSSPWRRSGDLASSTGLVPFMWK